MSMMIGIGTPSSQSRIPRPMTASFLVSGLIVAPSKHSIVRFVPANHTSTLGVSSRPLMGHSYRVIRRMRYGTDSTRERHNDTGGARLRAADRHLLRLRLTHRRAPRER